MSWNMQVLYVLCYCILQYKTQFIYKISPKRVSLQQAERMKTMKCRFWRRGKTLLKLKTIVCCARVDTPKVSRNESRAREKDDWNNNMEFNNIMKHTEESAATQNEQSEEKSSKELSQSWWWSRSSEWKYERKMFQIKEELLKLLIDWFTTLNSSF